MFPCSGSSVLSQCPVSEHSVLFSLDWWIHPTDPRLCYSISTGFKPHGPKSTVFGIWVISMSCQHMKDGLEIFLSLFFSSVRRYRKKTHSSKMRQAGEPGKPASQRGMVQKGGLGWLEAGLTALKMDFCEWWQRKMVFINNNNNSTVAMWFMCTASYHLFLHCGNASTPGWSHPKNQLPISRAEKLNYERVSLI